MNRRISVAAATGLAALFLVLSNPSLRAQIPTGEITGTVTDPSGAVVSGALITLTHRSTDKQRSVGTNTAGICDLPVLVPGGYDLKV